MCDLVGSNHA